MNHDAGIGQAEPFPMAALGQQHGRHGSCLPHAYGHDVRPDEGHGVQNGQAGRDRAAGRVNVNRNILFGVLRFQEKQLGDDQIGDLVVDRRPQKNDVLS